ncbi:hypothetical protein DFP73DRAFT_570633 [Morchella snyderi]|nr:hypothetical protein DFP73DRAFT_570633 [Morchella snyderi]
MSRRIFHNWFSQHVGSIAPRAAGSRISRSTTVDQSRTTITGPVGTLNQGVLSESGKDIRPATATTPQDITRAADDEGECESSELDLDSVADSLRKDGDYYSDHSSDSSLDDFSTPGPDLTLAQQKFFEVYRTLTRKWRLRSTKRVVEDIICQACIAPDSKFTPKTSLLPSYVIDFTDKAVENLFHRCEWEEMAKFMPALPDADEFQLDFLAKFATVRSVKDLRAAIHLNDYVPPGQTFNLRRDCNSWYSHLALSSLLNVYQSPNQALSSPHYEHWYTSAVWSSVMDQCVMLIKDITLERKEIHLRATVVRKNRERKGTGKGNYRKSGRHHDGVIQSIGERRTEYVVIEGSRSDEGGAKSTKYLDDWLKVSRAQRDMLNALHEEANHNPSFVPHLQVFGITTAAISFQSSRMVNPKGNICLLKRDDSLTIPAGLSAGLGDLLHILTYMPRLRKMIETTRSLIVGAVESKPTEEELKQDLRRGNVRKPVQQLTYAEDSD